MMRPTTYLEVNLKHFRHNLRQIQKRLTNGAKILLVVKAQAYGHGMLEMAKEACRMKNVVYLGVSSAQEALMLRQKGIQAPILVLSSVHPKEARELIKKNVTLTVSSSDEARRISHLARRLKTKAKVHAELDTGMGRLGASFREAVVFLFRVNELQGVNLEGAYSHFPSADEDAPSFSQEQVEVFDMATHLFKDLYPKKLKWLHMANSAGILQYPHAHFNLVRPGIMAYGINPTPRKLSMELKPVLSFKSRIAFIKSIEKGHAVSYGRTYQAKKRTRIATVPVGYSSGYPFALSGKAEVLIRGRSYPVVGRVTMDHVMVEIGQNSGIKLWDEVTFLGYSRPRVITAEELAKKARTIPYEILCSFGSQIPRLYKR